MKNNPGIGLHKPQKEINPKQQKKLTHSGIFNVLTTCNSTTKQLIKMT